MDRRPREAQNGGMESSSPGRERRWTWSLATALCVVFAAAQVQFLDDPYHWDSLYYVAASARDLYLHPGQLIPLGPWDNGHPPLFFWMLAAAWWAAGPTVTVSHLLMLAFSLSSLILLFLLARRLLGSRAGFLAALLMAANPIFFYHAGTVTGDIPLVTFTLAVMVAALSGRWGIAAASGCAMVLIRESALLFIPALAAAAWLVPRRGNRPGLAGPLLLTVVPGLALGAWFLIHQEITGWWIYSDRSREVKLSLGTIPYELYRRTGRPFLKDHGQWAATAVIAAAFLTDLVRRRLHARGREAWLLAGTGAAMILPIGVATALMSIFLPRYLLPVIPFFCALAGWALARAGRAMPVAAVAVMVPLLLAHEGEFHHGWESNRSYLRFLEVTQESARWLEESHPDARVMAEWPLWQAICDPMYGYVKRPLSVMIIGTRERFKGYCSPGSYSYVPRALAHTVGAADFDLLWLFTPRQLEAEYAHLASRIRLELVHKVEHGSRTQWFYRPVVDLPTAPMEARVPGGTLR